MTKAREFMPPEELKTEKAARSNLTKIQSQIATFSSLVPWPALVESFREDERRLRAVMAERGWTTSKTRQPRYRFPDAV